MIKKIKRIFNSKGSAILTVMVVMVMVMMMSILLLNIATISWSRSLRENELSFDRAYVESVGSAFVHEGVTLDTSSYSTDYDYDINLGDRKLTITRVSDSFKLLEVTLDEYGDLQSWRAYYR